MCSTSPSVYIIYSSILASASCIAMTQTYHTVGGVHVVTRAYDADALSSVRCVNSIGIGKDQHSVVWEKMNYNDLYYPIPLSESYSRVDRCFSNRKDNDIWGDWMRKPFISLPKDVSEFDPAWTTCSGVAIGAMDPPRALVPAAGFEDSPPNGPGPITQSSPSLPKATPGKLVPDPITGPTSSPQKGPHPPTSTHLGGTAKASVKEYHAQSTVRPQPYDGSDVNPLILLKDPSQDPPSKQPDPSPVVKEPSKSPEAAAPEPQQPSPSLPEVGGPTNTNYDPINAIVTLPEVGNKGPVAKEPAGEPEGNTSGDQGQLDPISNALFPTPSPGPSNDQLNIGGQKEEASSGQQQVSKPSDEDKESGEPNENRQKPTQDVPENEIGADTAAKSNVGNNSPVDNKLPEGQNGANTPTNGNVGNKSPAEKNKPEQPAPQDSPTPQGGDIPINSGGHVSAKNGGPSGSETSGTDTKNTNTENTGSNESDRGKNSKGPTSPPNGNAPIVETGESAIPQKQGNGKNGNDQPESGPTTFAFISSVPPPLAQGQTIARAPDGAAIVGTETIHPGEVQVVHGTPVSVAPAAIVVGSTTFAFNQPPQQNADDTAAPKAPVISQAAGGGLVIGTKTILPGQKDSVNGHDVSVGPSNVFIDSKSYSFPIITPPPTAPTHIDVAGLHIAQDSANAVVIGGSTYTPGAVATISGHTLSIGSSSIIVDGTPHTLPPTTATTARSPLLIGNQPVRKDPAGHIVVGTTSLSLSTNGETTIVGHVISLDTTSKHIIVVDQQTYPLPTTAGPVEIPAARPTGAGSPRFLIAGESVSRDAAGDLVVGSSTLVPGGSAVTVAGHVVSLPPTTNNHNTHNRNNSVIIIDQATYTLPPPSLSSSSFPTPTPSLSSSPPTTTAPPLTLPNNLVITPGATAVTVSGKMISLFADGKGVVVDGETVTLTATGTGTGTGAEVTGLVGGGRGGEDGIALTTFGAAPSGSASRSPGRGGGDDFGSGAASRERYSYAVAVMVVLGIALGVM